MLYLKVTHITTYIFTLLLHWAKSYYLKKEVIRYLSAQYQLCYGTALFSAQQATSAAQPVCPSSSDTCRMWMHLKAFVLFKA